jgi:hypothetical protein
MLLDLLAGALPGGVAVPPGPLAQAAAEAGLELRELPDRSPAALASAPLDGCGAVLLPAAETDDRARAALGARGFSTTVQALPAADGGMVTCFGDVVANIDVLLVADVALDMLLPELAAIAGRTLAELRSATGAQHVSAVRLHDALSAARDAGRARLHSAVGGNSGAPGFAPPGLASLVDRQTRALMGLRGAIEGVAELDREPLVAPPGAWIRRACERARQLSTPRLGVFYQHAPQRLMVTRSMLDVRPPQPAPTISIVTPSLNQGKFLGRTLRSVLDQDYPALEYVVQDGGSTDDSAAILIEHEHRLARWTSAPDAGQADAINRGFDGTTGEIMACLNSDDLLLPGSLAWVARYFQKHPDVDAVYGQRVIVDDDDRQIGIWITPPHDDSMLGLSNVVPNETLFWRRRVWERVGGMDPSFRFALDWDFLLRLSQAGARIVRINRYVGAFRAHGAQKSQAQLAVGDAESDLLRERAHDRPMTWEEATARMRPYLRRHVVHHTAHRLLARLPIARVELRWE